MTEQPLTDEVLGAYADGELDRKLLRQVEAELAADPQARQRLQDIRYVSNLVRATTRAPIDEGIGGIFDRVPAVSDGGHSTPRTRLPWQGVSGYAVAASVAAVAAVGLVWLGSVIARPHPSWVDGTLIYHEQFLGTVHSPRRVPLDVRDPDPAYVASKLQATLPFTPTIPDLSAQGFVLQGARLIATPQGWMLYVSYKDEDSYIGLTAVKDEEPAPQQTVSDYGLNLVSWEQDEIVYSIASTLDTVRLQELSIDAQAAIGL